jgi:membrane-associated protease RseP (regulator of RpoE activity)
MRWPPERPRWLPKSGGRFPWIQLALFLVTFLTATYAGALHHGVNPWEDPAKLDQGIPYALALMAILLVHEFGHYALARFHGVDATLPYFLPAPPLFGTFGAFIRLKSPPLNRRQLLDVGVAGPIAGVVVAIAAAYVGLRLSAVTDGPAGGEIVLGSSLLLSLLSNLALGGLPSDANITLHPVGFAGWIGLLLTGMNLLPAGQLDGGHVLYALVGERHRQISRLTIVFVLLLGALRWKGWLFWGVLLTVTGSRHPPPHDPDTPLNPGRIWLAVLTMALLILTFVPSPFHLVHFPIMEVRP